jgi:hypothetical protein
VRARNIREWIDREENVWSSLTKDEQKVVSLMLGEHMINLSKAMTREGDL